MDIRSLKRVSATSNPHCHSDHARSNGNMAGLGKRAIVPLILGIGLPFVIGAAVGCYRYKDK